MVKRPTTYHSYTHNQVFRIADMHPAHLANAIAVIKDGQHSYYNTDHAVYRALLEQLAAHYLLSSAKRAKVRTAKPTQPNHLPTLRSLAKKMLLYHGVVSADTLREFARQQGVYGIPTRTYCNVFRSKDFQVVGRKPSSSPTAHSREIRVYVAA